MAQNPTHVTGRRPVRDSLGALLLAMVVVWSGCSAGSAGTTLRSTSGEHRPASSFVAAGGAGGLPENNTFAPDAGKLLAPFLACTSPADFVELQRGVDMARLVERLDEWSAVRLGALGPVLPEAAEALNRKRASFLVTATREYGAALAEVFALFVLHSAFDKDLEQVLRQLAEDKRLGQTLGQMATAREQLRQRGFHLSDYPDRPERPLEDGRRGVREGMGDVLSSAPLFQTGALLSYAAQKGQLPPPYRQALDEVEGALAKQALEPGNVLLGVVDEMTFGVPLGFYHLAAGVGHGAYSLTQGQYEQATRELTPAALMVALYAGGKGARYLSEARGAPGTSTGTARALQGLEPRLEELKATAERLRGQLGGEALQAVARYLRADPEAALLVAEGGEAGAAALYEARGNVPKAQALMSQAKSERPGSPGRGAGPGSVRAAWPPSRTRRASPERCWTPGSWRWSRRSRPAPVRGRGGAGEATGGPGEDSAGRSHGPPALERVPRLRQGAPRGPPAGHRRRSTGGSSILLSNGRATSRCVGWCSAAWPSSVTWRSCCARTRPSHGRSAASSRTSTSPGSRRMWACTSPRAACASRTCSSSSSGRFPASLLAWRRSASRAGTSRNWVTGRWGAQ